MKKIFNSLLVTLGGIFVLLVVVGIGYFFLFGIHNGKAIIGTTKTVNGKVQYIYDAGAYDIGFKLEDNSNRYYINRGQQNGLVLNDLKKAYVGKELAISYVSQLGRESGHINRVMCGDSLVYNELKN